MSKFYPNYKYKLYNSDFGEQELEMVKKVFSSGILTHGEFVEQLEKQFAEYVGCEFAAAVNSCTSALYLCLEYKKRFCNIKSVKIPSITFVSVANAIQQAGLALKFSDEIKVGSAYDLKDETAVNKIVDAAHQLERGIYKKFPNSLMCFSFYPIKQLGGAEGGIIATNNGLAANWLRQARNHGMERKTMFDWDYDVKFAGWKMNMTNLQAGILLTKLEKLDRLNFKREKTRDYYNKAFGLNNQSLHLYPIFVKNRKQFLEKMKQCGIQCSVHFKPIHWQTFYKVDYSLPYSNWWGNHEVSIPFHDKLTNKDLDFIVNKVKQYGTFIKYS